jgi:3-oxoacyl-[acyl-carrier protein] reductase
MNDSYLKFANSPVGNWLANALGLPKPLPLERFVEGAPLINGSVLIGAGPNPALLGVLAQVLRDMKALSVAHAELPQWMDIANQAGMMSGRWGSDGQPGEKLKALVFDATGMTDSSQSGALHQFFHDSARSVLPCGRVVVLGRPPEGCTTPRTATAQRALEGLTRALGKELKRAITVQLVYVAEGAENQLESTLRFLLSARSAYVSGQVIRIGAADSRSLDWTRPLNGKTVLVTGASRGIGVAIARTLARDGARVVCLDIPPTKAELDAVAATINGSALALDIAAIDAAEQLRDAALLDGGWDVIVHNAGITRDKTIANMKEHLWQQVVNINLTAQERINEVLVESGALKAGGRIICVSSISGIAGNMGQTNYGYSKAGVIGMVQASAPGLAAKGITINAVAPGFIETQMTAAVPFAIREAGRRMNSMSQGGLPVDVAEAIAWFASPASGGITGNVVRVCGQSIMGA